MVVAHHRPTTTLIHQLSITVDGRKNLLTAAPINSTSTIVVVMVVVTTSTVWMGEQSLALVVASLGLAAPIATGNPRVQHHMLQLLVGQQVLLGQLNGPKTMRCAGSRLCCRRICIIIITAFLFIICFLLLDSLLELTVDQGVALIELLACVSHVIGLICLYSRSVDSVERVG